MHINFLGMHLKCWGYYKFNIFDFIFKDHHLPALQILADFVNIP